MSPRLVTLAALCACLACSDFAAGPFEESAPPESQAAFPLIDGPKKPTRRWAFVLVDVDGGGNMVNKDNAVKVLFGADRPDSIRSYFREVSYGVQDLEGEVLGPFPYKMEGRCDTDRLAQALMPQVPGRFNQYLWYFGTRQTACSWAGIANLGRADRPTRHTWYNAVSLCNVLVQEPGHNFGMVHSAAMRCTRAGQPVPIAWPTEPQVVCANVEYGNPFNPMGGGECTHMNGVQKAYQDWLGGCNVIKATASGTFTIYPLESACDGPQLLHVPFPAPRAFGKAGVLTGYYLELRAPIGRDRALAPQVLAIVANDVREARFTGNNNWLLDMTPETETAEDAALVVGKQFVDALPGGPKFTVRSVDAQKAVIEVELGGKPAPPEQLGSAVCSDLVPFVPNAPVRCVAPATPAAPVRDGGAGDAASDAGMPVPTNPHPGGLGGAGGGEPGTGGAASVGSGGAGGRGAGGVAGTAGTAGTAGSSAASPAGTAPGSATQGGCAVAPLHATNRAWATLLALLILAATVRRGRAARRHRATISTESSGAARQRL